MKGGLHIYLIGSDIIEVDKVKESINYFGKKYLLKLYTDKEIDYCMRFYNTYAQNFAARFAVKEAVIKILNPSDYHISFRDIELEKNNDGSCNVRLHNNARILAKNKNINDFSVSLSHEEKYALATVIASVKRGD
ncbi:MULTISPECIES: holo-ACP synthase [Bacillus]|uniref:Holo-[acyl-carrier-protein] synthase n=3 Tax=Bacillus cereus group TaxID=86661 RepID=A0A9W5P291_BACCE|nr:MULTISPECIES: holo-ACP synthase [Bacillus]EEM49199.1 holo-[acyl-carrier-protein] synthase [Bacillus thuringiensis serovar pakistani str. T13001]EJR71549.1 phosphopantetheine-protein transferase domain protein [Bacillus cereus VD154]KIU74697.1 holo-ACP synthase [Bacillus thuringiensis Sbt003]MDA1951894.1 holo-ACP synthase [Bacillus cereus]MDZ4652093.1 holo-ACP synthase [Bacillus cereus]